MGVAVWEAARSVSSLSSGPQSFVNRAAARFQSLGR